MRGHRNTEKTLNSSLKQTDPLILRTDTVITESVIDIYHDDILSNQNVLANRPLLAAFLCLLSAGFFSLQFVSAKLVYRLYPSFNPSSMLFMRTLGACIWIIPHALYLNQRQKRKNLREGLPHSHILLQRNVSCLKFSVYILSILLVQGIAFFMIKYLSLTEVTIFLSMGPILTVFFSSCFLADAALKTKAVDSLKLVVGCIGVVMIVVGKKVFITEHGTVDQWPSKLWHYGVMALAPVAIVIINLSLSTMRNFHYIVTPFYISVLTVTVCGVIGLCDMDSFLPQR